jgi:tetratricopeptide (TPR) repeat protein
VRVLPIAMLLVAGVVALASASVAVGQQDLCAAADSLQTQGRVAQAEALYLKALESESTSDRTCGVNGLQELAGGKGVCAHPASLEKTDKAKALAAYRLILRAQPKAACAKEGEERLTDTSVLGGVESTAKDIGRWIVILLAFLVAGYLLFIAVLATIGRWWRPFRLWITSVPLIQEFLAPRLKFGTIGDGALDKALGVEFGQLTRGRLTADSDNGVVLASTPATLSGSLQGVKDLSSQLGIAVAILDVLNQFIPRSWFELDGSLHAAPGQGGTEGVTIALQRNSRHTRSVTLWCKELRVSGPESNARVHALSGPAAAWLGHEIASATDRPVLETLDSRSFLLFAAGHEAHEAGDEATAWTLYLDALARDPDNAAALINVAAILEGHGWPDPAKALRDRAIQILIERAKA